MINTILLTRIIQNTDSHENIDITDKNDSSDKNGNSDIYY